MAKKKQTPTKPIADGSSGDETVALAHVADEQQVENPSTYDLTFIEEFNSQLNELDEKDVLFPYLPYLKSLMSGPVQEDKPSKIPPTLRDASVVCAIMSTIPSFSSSAMHSKAEKLAKHLVQLRDDHDLSLDLRLVKGYFNV